MKSLIRNLLIPVAGLALAATTATAAPWPPAKGDLILGVQATGGTGATTNVFFNLGAAHSLRDNPSPGTLANLNAELEAAFGAGWSARTDLYFGVFANRSNATPFGIGSAAPENGDPARTIYASKPATVAGTATPWTGFSISSLGIAATAHHGQIDAIATLSANGNQVSTLVEASNPVQWANGWSEWNPTPGTAFSVFGGGIQAQINATAAIVDVFRVVSTTGSGSYVTSVTLAANGDVSAARAGGATSYFTVTATATNGSVSGAGTIVYASGSTAKLTAAPSTGFGFVNWTGDGSGSANPLSLVMNSSKSVTANFAPLPSVTSPTATSITETGATLGGNVTSDGGQTVTERGVVYSTLAANANPLLDGSGVTKSTAAGTTGVFTTAVAGLTAGTTYAYKAYATTAAGDGYTPVAFFTTDTAVTLTGGIGTVSSRQIQAGDTHRFTFTLGAASDADFTSTGLTTGSWELRDGSNALVDSGTGNVAVSDVLTAGNYSLSVTNTGGAAQTFSLNLDASNEAEPKPDVSVGLTATATTGINVYSPAAQSAIAISKRAVPKTVFALVDNDGPLDDTMKLQGSAGNALFAVAYTGPGGNITAQMVTGTFTTASLAEADAPVSISAKVTPNKRKLTKKVRKGKRLVTTYLKKTYAGFIKASASSDASLSDTVTYQVKTTP